ncbi:hypothetical protein [Burkholderia glumae]|nr:hypothetical protein [Burkholderia glumae]
MKSTFSTVAERGPGAVAPMRMGSAANGTKKSAPRKPRGALS